LLFKESRWTYLNNADQEQWSVFFVYHAVVIKTECIKQTKKKTENDNLLLLLRNGFKILILCFDSYFFLKNDGNVTCYFSIMTITLIILRKRDKNKQLLSYVISPVPEKNCLSAQASGLVYIYIYIYIYGLILIFVFIFLFFTGYKKNHIITINSVTDFRLDRGNKLPYFGGIMV